MVVGMMYGKNKKGAARRRPLFPVHNKITDVLLREAVKHLLGSSHLTEVIIDGVTLVDTKIVNPLIDIFLGNTCKLGELGGSNARIGTVLP